MNDRSTDNSEAVLSRLADDVQLVDELRAAVTDLVANGRVSEARELLGLVKQITCRKIGLHAVR